MIIQLLFGYLMKCDKCKMAKKKGGSHEYFITQLLDPSDHPNMSGMWYLKLGTDTSWICNDCLREYKTDFKLKVTWGIISIMVLVYIELEWIYDEIWFIGVILAFVILVLLIFTGVGISEMFGRTNADYGSELATKIKGHDYKKNILMTPKGWENLDKKY